MKRNLGGRPLVLMVTRSYSCRLLSRPSLLVNRLPFGMWFTSCSPETNPKHSVVKGEVVANYWILLRCFQNLLLLPKLFFVNIRTSLVEGHMVYNDHKVANI